jgi:hypothetical protein
MVKANETFQIVVLAGVEPVAADYLTPGQAAQNFFWNSWGN